MWDVCTNTSTTGEKKTNKDHACNLKAMDWKNVTKLDYTSRFVQQCFSRDLDQPRPRRGGTPNTASQRRNTKQHSKGTSRDIDSTYHETLKTFPRIRELHGGFSTRELNVAACVATSRRLAVTTKQPSAHAWAESPK